MSVGPILDHPIPDDFLIQIGDITVSFGILENLMQSLAGLRISDNHRVTQIITSELAFKNLRALIVSLFLERGETNEHYLEVKELMNRAGKVEERRNQITHSLWVSASDELHISRVKTTAKEGKGLMIRREDISLDELKSIALEIKQLTFSIVSFSFYYAKAENIPHPILIKYPE